MNNAEFLSTLPEFNIKESIKDFDKAGGKNKNKNNKHSSLGDEDGNGSKSAGKRSDGKVWRKGKLVDLSSADKSNGSKPGYRDRAAERARGEAGEYKASREMLEAFKGSEDMTQYLGGR